MPRLPLRWLSMRLERLLGLRWLRRLLPVMGPLRLVLTDYSRSIHIGCHGQVVLHSAGALKPPNCSSMACATARVSASPPRGPMI